MIKTFPCFLKFCLFNHFQPTIASLPNSDLLVGVAHIDGNHWAGVIVRTRPPEFIFLEPFGRESSAIGMRIKNRFKIWASKWNRSGFLTMFPVNLQLTFFKHDRQSDATSCGIWTMVLIERVLKGEPLTGIDIVREGGRIAASIMDATGNLSHICSYCGLQAAGVTGEIVQCVMCRRRSFHASCVQYPWEGEFSCEICDPEGNVPTRCTRCSLIKPGGAESLRAQCRENCGRFVHTSCLYVSEAQMYDCMTCDR